MINVAVGAQREEFSIHGNRLNKTGFFAVHGFPEEAPHLAIPIPQTETDAEAGNDHDNVKAEQQSNGGGDGESNSGQNQAQMFDYQIAARDFQAPKAFRVFVEALYNEEPDPITDREGLKTALKAYKFAREYQHWVLQNRLLERFREHYNTHKVKLDEFLWMVKHFGDDADATPLTRYILEQIAYDISNRGFNTFSGENIYLKHYLEEGQRATRAALFAILARHANDPRHPDPAQGKNEWRVVESGATAGEWSPDPFCQR